MEPSLLQDEQPQLSQRVLTGGVCKPGARVKEYLTAVYSPDTEQVTVTSERCEQVENTMLLSSCWNAV